MVRLARDVVRRELRGGQVFSNVHRSDAEIVLLAERGGDVRILELEGSLFFGSADRLGRRIDALLQAGARTVVVDVRRLTHVDSTGASIAVRAVERAKGLGRTVVLSGLRADDPADPFVAALGGPEELRVACCAATLNEALAWAEDQLLDELIGGDRYSAEIGLDQVEALRGLSADDLATLAGALRREVYEDGDVVLEQLGEADRV